MTKIWSEGDTINLLNKVRGWQAMRDRLEKRTNEELGKILWHLAHDYPCSKDHQILFDEIVKRLCSLVIIEEMEAEKEVEIDKFIAEHPELIPLDEKDS